MTATRIADARHPVSDEPWNRVHEHCDDDQIVAPISLIH
jgi:hypothetical protein